MQSDPFVQERTGKQHDEHRADVAQQQSRDDGHVGERIEKAEIRARREQTPVDLPAPAWRGQRLETGLVMADTQHDGQRKKRAQQYDLRCVEATGERFHGNIDSGSRQHGQRHQAHTKKRTLFG